MLLTVACIRCRVTSGGLRTASSCPNPNCKYLHLELPNRNLHRTWPVHSPRSSPSNLQYPGCLHQALATRQPHRSSTSQQNDTEAASKPSLLSYCWPPPASSPGWAGGHGQGKGSTAKEGSAMPQQLCTAAMGSWQPGWFRAAFRLFCVTVRDSTDSLLLQDCGNMKLP